MANVGKGQYDIKNLEPEEGGRRPLPTNKVSLRPPSLSYNYSESSENKLDRAFDILFETMLEEGKIKIK